MYLQLKLHCCFLLTKKKLWKNEGLRNSFENCQTSFGDGQIKFVVFNFTCEVLHLEEIGGYFRNKFDDIKNKNFSP